MPTPTKQAVLFANGHSGRGRRWLFPVVDACRSHDIELVSIHLDLDPHAIEQALRHAGARGVTTVLAAGGDGTVGCVARHVLHTDFVLGVIPAGTSNDFARSLSIPISPIGSVGVVAAGIATRVDMGEVNGTAFCHAALIGLNAEFSRQANRCRRVLGRLSFPVAALLVYRGRRRFSLKIEMGATRRSFEAIEAGFMNAPVYAGPLELEVQHLDLTDHKLRLVVVEDVRLRTIARALPVLLRRKQVRLHGIHSLSFTDVQFDSPESQPLTLDGELDGPPRGRARVLPAALRVYVPPAFIEGQHERRV